MNDSNAITIDPPRLKLKPGEQKKATITVHNRSEEVAQYWLKLGEGQSNWAMITPDQISAFPFEKTQAQISIQPPPGTRGATYHLLIRAISQAHTGLEDEAQLDVEVPAAEPSVEPVPTVDKAPARVVERSQVAASQIAVQVEAVQDSKLPAPARQWRLSLRNSGRLLDTFSFSTRGIASDWVSFSPPELTLNPGEAGSALLTVRPGADAAARTYPFTLRTGSRLNANERTELPLQIEVAPKAGFLLDIFPPEAESQGQREFTLTLTSDPGSNTNLTLTLMASDQDNLCDYTFAPTPVSLPAGQKATSTLRVRPRTALAPNERRTIAIQVVATPRGGGTPRTVVARLNQTGAPPMSLRVRPQVQTGEIEATYALYLTNPAAIDTVVNLSAQDPEDACDFRFQPSILTVSAHGQAQAHLTVKARTFNESEKEKTISFQVSATRQGEVLASATISGTLVQRPVTPVTLKLVPPQQSQPGRARYVLKAFNPRHTRVQLSLEAHDETDALAFSFTPNVMMLSPGAEGGAVINARPKDKLMQGEKRRVHHFTVTGTMEGSDDPLTVNGFLAQVAGIEWPDFVVPTVRLGFWVLRWIIALLLLVFLLTLALAGIEEFARVSANPSVPFNTDTNCFQTMSRWTDILALNNPGVRQAKPVITERVCGTLAFSPFSSLSRLIVGVISAIVQMVVNGLGLRFRG